jgi:hypothetical protein
VLTDRDLMNVQSACEAFTKSVTIFVHAAGTDSPFEGNLLNIARQVSGVSQERIVIEDTSEPVFPGKPSLTLSNGETRNIRYLAAPEGREFGPFLEALSLLGCAGTNLGSAAGKSLEKLTQPAHVLVLMADACPNCPSAVRSALYLAVGRPMITTTVVDVLWFEDMAQKYKVRSTPTIIVNEGLTLVGQVSIPDLAQKLVEADSGSLTSVLKSMIDSGRAEQAAELLCRSDKPQTILPLYCSEEFSTRIGALVVMEDALQINPRIFDPLLARLTDLLFADEAGLRGDTADLLGKIGNPEAIPALQKAAQDPDSDVREAALEALEILAG